MSARLEAERKQQRAARRKSDLDLWLEKVEALGELKRISAEVDPDLEAATITYLLGSKKSPVLLFENVKGHPGHKALYNMIGCNLSRFCLMIGEAPVDHLGCRPSTTTSNTPPFSVYPMPVRGCLVQDEPEHGCTAISPSRTRIGVPPTTS